MNRQINTIIFDLGGVLIDWNPRYLYRNIFDSEEKVEWFIENIWTNEWDENQDAGRSLYEVTEELVFKFPEFEHEIRAYYNRWEEMLGGDIPATVEILRLLMNAKNFRLYALTNWSAETFPIALARYGFLKWFDGIIVSGEEKTRKPFPEIYHILFRRFNVKPSETVFIDDNYRNIESAKALELAVIHFQSPDRLEKALKKLKILS
jgi:2-haloacid dehalogenase